MELAGHKCVGFCEFDKFAVASYTSMHLLTEEQREYLNTLPIKKRQKEILKDEYRNGEWYASDIREVHSEQLPESDCWCFGAPCFVAGTLITTKRGMIPIEQIRSGDMVLTHKNRFQKVIHPMVNVKTGIYKLRIQGSPITELTGNHRLYVRDRIKKWNNIERKYKNMYTDPYWKAVEDFNGKELIEFPCNKESSNEKNLTDEECWLIGRYVADGYLQNTVRKDRPSNIKRVVFCIGEDKIQSFQQNCRSIHMYKSKTIKSSAKFTTSNKRLYYLCHECGRKAENKIIPSFIMDLPTEKLKKFLNGYMAGDGCTNENIHKATTVSQRLAYQLGQCIYKVYQLPYSIYYDQRPDKHVIEDRIVNQKDTWQIVFRNTNKSLGKVIDGVLWMPVKEITYDSNRTELVYNMEVENDNSYTANNIGAHNCQDFSVAGKRAGMDGDRSSLIREIFRLLEEQKEEDRPEWLIYENVKGMLSSNKGLDYLSIVSEMDRPGYDIEWQNINSRWWVPQNRERIYTIGHLRRFGSRKILPVTGTDGENNLYLIGCFEGRNSQRDRIYGEHGNSPTISTCPGGNTEPKVGIAVVAKTNSKYRSNSDVHSIKGIMSTCMSRDYKSPKQIAIPVLTPDRAEKRQNGRRFKENGDPMFTLTAQDKHGVAIDPIGGCYKGVSPAFNRGIYDGECRTIKADSSNCVALGIIDQQGRLNKKVSLKNEVPTLRSETHGNLPQVCIDVSGDVDRTNEGIYVVMPEGFVVYAVWYEKEQCYITIRKLTPKECFRLQGWADDYFERAAFVNSDSQLYKQAGNGVTVSVVEAIAENMKK